MPWLPYQTARCEPLFVHKPTNVDWGKLRYSAPLRTGALLLWFVRVSYGLLVPVNAILAGNVSCTLLRHLSQSDCFRFNDVKEVEQNVSQVSRTNRSACSINVGGHSRKQFSPVQACMVALESCGRGSRTGGPRGWSRLHDRHATSSSRSFPSPRFDGAVNN